MSLQDDRAFFNENGYLVIEDLLSGQQLQTCRDEIERLHHVADDLEKQGDADLKHFQREPYAQGSNRDDGLPVLRKIEETGKFSPLFRDLAKTPRLISTLQALLCDDLLQFRSTLMLKPAFHGSAHAYHQDSSYWPIDPPDLITVSIALTDATPQNGCIRVIPGSHKWGLLDWGRISLKKDESIDNVDFDTSKAIELPLKAGSALLFHSLTVHGSGPNDSPDPRNTALYAYFSPHVALKQSEGGPSQRSFRVVAGLNGAGEHQLTCVAGSDG